MRETRAGNTGRKMGKPSMCVGVGLAPCTHGHTTLQRTNTPAATRVPTRDMHCTCVHMYGVGGGGGGMCGWPLVSWHVCACVCVSGCLSVCRYIHVCSGGFVWLAICFMGIMGSFIIYGMVLEYATSGGRKLHELSYIFVTSSIYALTAYVGRLVQCEVSRGLVVWCAVIREARHGVWVPTRYVVLVPCLRAVAPCYASQTHKWCLHVTSLRPQQRCLHTSC